MYYGDEGPAKKAAFDLPSSIAIDPLTNDLVVMDQANQVIRAIDGDGNIRRIAGECVIEEIACADGQAPSPCLPNTVNVNKFACYNEADRLVGLAKECAKACTPTFFGENVAAMEMRMAQPFGQMATPAGRLDYDDEGNLYFADTGNHVIRKIDTNGMVTTYAGIAPMDGVPQRGYAGDGGPATSALLDYPVYVEVDDDVNFFFADVANHCIRKIDTGGIITRVAGKCGERGFSGDGGDPLEATFTEPYGIELAPGRLYIADSYNNRIRVVNFTE
jgi:hypothetical protein